MEAAACAGSGLPEPYAVSTRSQPDSSCARASARVNSLSNAGPERGGVSVPSLVAPMPRNSTGMVGPSGSGGWGRSAPRTARRPHPAEVDVAAHHQRNPDDHTYIVREFHGYGHETHA